MAVERRNGTFATATPLREVDESRSATSLAGLLRLRCGDVLLRSDGADLATVYDTEPLLPLSWQLLPLTGRSDDRLANLARFAARSALPASASSSTLDVAVLLHYEEAAPARHGKPGQLAPSPGVLSRADFPGVRQGQTPKATLRALSQCALETNPTDAQMLWPPGQLLALADNGYHPFQQETLVPSGGWEMARGADGAAVQRSHVARVARLGAAFAAAGAGARRAPASLWRYPSEAGGWRNVVPPLPHYCGLHEGSLTRAQVRALRAEHETAFIEASAGGGEGSAFSIPGLDPILSLGMKVALSAIMDPFMEQVGDHFANQGASQSAANNLESVPKAVVHMTAPALAYNITNLATDAIAFHLAAGVAASICAELTSKVSAEVADAVGPSIEQSSAAAVTGAVPEKLSAVLPTLLSRSLPVHLTSKLTKALTHSLVPTLTLALTHNSHQHIWCHFCYYKHQYCNYCHDAPQSQYYTTFYATYYADYYTDYYEPYYTKSIVKVDTKMHDPAQQEKAREVNLYKPGAELPPRPVTPDGTILQ